MTAITTPSSFSLMPGLETAWQDVDSFSERLCLTAGIGAIEQMLREDARKFAGTPHSREAALPTWTAPQAEDRLGRWAMNLMPINSRCQPTRH